MNSDLVKVAVDAPISEALTYLNSLTDAQLTRGDSVTVPLGKRKTTGVILGATSPDANIKLKAIESKNEKRKTIPETYLKWLEWLSDYYMHPIGQVLGLAFPPLENEKRQRASRKAPVITPQKASHAPTLTEDQTRVIENIRASQNFSTHLLFGVTGSGKTEVYLHLLEEVIRTGHQALVLVPEISLTPQLLDRFVARFGDKIAVLHSHLTDREKTEQWWQAARGDKPILLGARSALFCPLEKLRFIIVDEEHESSFKQDEKLKYHARDAAIMLAKFADCPIILGSATPSLESWSRAEQGTYQLHRMPSRVEGRNMPEMTVVDLREERGRRRDEPSEEPLPFWLSQKLFDELQLTFQQNEQAALFLNRRGIAQVFFCSSCGHSFECPNCAISLTVHGPGHLVCHYCDYSDRVPEHCPQCQSHEIQPLGMGTELIENDILKLFPNVRLARADRDEIQTRESLEDLIRKMESRELDILIGTQMIAKGLDFPGLTLVGLVMADVGLSMPDFRASERSFQLLTQVSGRSGRHSKERGRVFVQTYNPGHPAVSFALQHDYEGFAKQELTVRSELNYPPYGRLAMLRIHGQTLGQCERAAELVRYRAQALLKSRESYSQIKLLGPTAAPLAKLRGKFRFQALIKGESPQILRGFCRQLLSDSSWLPKGTKVAVDIDPINML